MAKFPEYSTVNYGNPLTVGLQYKTLISNFEGLGKEIRRRKWLFVKRNITLKYQYISRTDARTIWDFYNDVYGSYTAFLFFLEYSDTYVKEYFCTGDGATTTFTLPGKYSASYTIYHDGIAYSGSDFTLNADAGEEGADQVVFDAAPNTGVRLTISFTGYLVIRCRFAEDNLTYEQMYNKFNNIGIVLTGLLLDEI